MQNLHIELPDGDLRDFYICLKRCAFPMTIRGHELGINDSKDFIASNLDKDDPIWVDVEKAGFTYVGSVDRTCEGSPGDHVMSLALRIVSPNLEEVVSALNREMRHLKV